MLTNAIARQKMFGDTQSQISEVRNLLAQSQCPIIVVGRGVDKLSGLLSFNELHEASLYETIYGWQRLGERRRMVQSAKISQVHQSIADWALARGADRTIIMTYTIDALMVKCRIRTVDIAGSIWRLYCPGCQKPQESSQLKFSKKPVCIRHNNADLLPEFVAAPFALERRRRIRNASGKGDALVLVGIDALQGAKLQGMFPELEMSRTAYLNDSVVHITASIHVNAKLLDSVPPIFAL